MVLEYALVAAVLVLLFIAPVVGGVSPATALALAIQDQWATLAWLIASL